MNGTRLYYLNGRHCQRDTVYILVFPHMS